MTQDELMLKIGIDQSQVAPGLEDFKRKVTGALGGVKGSFISAGQEAGTFRQMLSEIAAQSPILGLALRTAINPIVGIMTTATLLIRKFVNEQKEATREANNLADAIGRQRAALIGAVYSDDPSGSSRALTLASARSAAEMPIEDYRKQARAQLEERERRGRTVTMTPEGPIRTAGPLFTDDDVLLLGEQLKNAAVLNYERLMREAKAERERNAVYEALRDSIEEEYELEHDLQKQKNDALNKELDAIIKHDKELLQTIEEEQKRRTKAKESARDYADKYRPGIEDLAKYNTPLGAQARYIAWLERGATHQYAMGDVTGATETVFGKGGIRELRQQLSNAGIIKEDIGELFKAATDGNGNLKVNIVEGAE